MAVRIPGYLSQASIETDRSGMPRPHFDKSLGAALAGFGNAMSNAAEAAIEDQNKKDLFDDQMKYMLHREQTQTAMADAQQQMRPDGEGFTNGFFASRAEPDQAWLASISERNRDHFMKRWAVDQENFKQQANRQEMAVRGKYEADQIATALDMEARRVANDPAYKAQAADNMAALLTGMRALPPGSQIAIKRNIVETLDSIAAEGKYKNDPAGLAKALGVSHLFINSKYGVAAGASGTAGAMTAGEPQPGGSMRPDDVRAIFLDTVKRQGLVGVIPPDGAKYGIKSGSAEEWANFFTGLAKHESGLDNRTVGDAGKFRGGSRGLLQLSYDDAKAYGFNNGRPFSSEQLADPNFNAAVGVAIAKNLIDKNGSIQGGMGKYWGPISKEGWTPGQGRDRGLPWASWNAGVASGPTRAAAAANDRGDPLGDPEFAGIPFDKRVQMVQRAFQQQDQADKAAKAAIGAMQTENKNRFGLAIEMEDPNVTQQFILSERQRGNIDDKDTTELLKALDAKQKNSAVVSAIMSASEGGQSLGLTPFDEKNRAGADGAYDKYVSSGMSQVDALDRVQRASGVVPPRAIAAANGTVVSGQPQQAAKVLQVMSNMLNRAPRAFDGLPGGERMATDAMAYRFWSQYVSPEQAAANVQQSHDAGYAEKRKLKDEQSAAIKKDILSASNMEAALGKSFDQSDWAGNPDIGIDPNSREKLLQDFATLTIKNMEMYGDLDAAKAAAQQQLKRVWGVSKMQGASGWFTDHPLNGAVMEYPPEMAYPAVQDAGGKVGHDYVMAQAKQFLAAGADDLVKAGLKEDAIQSVKFLPVTDGARGLTTQDAWATKQAVPYHLVYSYKNKDGYTMFGVMSAPFTADPKRAYGEAMGKVDDKNRAAREKLLRTYEPWVQVGDPENGGLSIGPGFIRGATPGQEALRNEAAKSAYARKQKQAEDDKKLSPQDYINKYGIP